MAYRNKKYLCSLSPFLPSPLLPSLLPPSIAISSSPMLCRSDEYHPSKSEMQRNLSHFSPLFPLSYLSLFSPPPSVSLAPLSFSLSLPSFLIYLPFLPLAYVDLILSHYDDLRFSFSCWPIKTKQQQQQALPFLLLQADS